MIRPWERGRSTCISTATRTPCRRTGVVPLLAPDFAALLERLAVCPEQDELWPNHPLQQTAAAMLVSRSIPALGAAAAAELRRSPAEKTPLATAKGQEMSTASNHDERIAKMTFASVYPHYLAKVEKKGRSKAELHQVLEWLTGYDEGMLLKHIDDKTTFAQFFRHAKIHPNACLITGVICGYRVEEIENPLTQQVRYLDKLVDELAKGKKMVKILRSA
jgi:hypothetical protein